jgi:hypothetical protein
MNSLPGREQPLPLLPCLLQHAAQISSPDADDPIECYAGWSREHDLCLATLSEHVHMGRTVIVGKNDEPEAMGTVNNHHQD